MSSLGSGEALKELMPDGSLEREVGRLREVYTKEAVELLKADGLLPEGGKHPAIH